MILLRMSPAVFVTALACAQAPAGGDLILPEDSFSLLRFSGSSALGRSEFVDVDGMPFARALRIDMPGPFRNPWDLQVFANTMGDIRNGDVIWMSLWARGASLTETSEASAVAHIQRKGGDFAKIVSLPFVGGSEWKQFMVPVKVATALTEGQHEFVIHLGTQPQLLEIAGVQLINFRDHFTTAQLPRTRQDLPWAKADAPWRRTASESIEAIRKADIHVRVVDADQRPVSDAEVRVTMRRHEFGFGSAVAADGIFAGPDSEQYRETIRTWFNKVVLENDLKWPNWESNRSKALNALAWLRENGIDQVRGHTLVWPSWRYMPVDVQNLQTEPEKLRLRVREHIADELGATAGQCVEWDVLNEPFTNTDLQRVLGEEEMAQWFIEAKRHEPAAMLYINDYSILSNGGNDAAHQNHYFETIGKLLDWGAPVDGIGMQGHFGATLTPPERIWQILDRFSVYGKRIQVTEFDIDTDDEEMQAQYTRDFLTAVFAHPSIDGFMMWGFWEGRHWRPRAAMLRRDWSTKPNGEAFRDLVFREWWTDVKGSTDADGVFRTRGFKGAYEIVVTRGERSASVPLKVSGPGITLEVVLP